MEPRAGTGRWVNPGRVPVALLTVEEAAPVDRKSGIRLAGYAPPSVTSRIAMATSTLSPPFVWN
jgi:hypothetical protein